jgi:hypothetical protein
LRTIVENDCGDRFASRLRLYSITEAKSSVEKNFIKRGEILSRRAAQDGARRRSIKKGKRGKDGGAEGGRNEKKRRRVARGRADVW